MVLYFKITFSVFTVIRFEKDDIHNIFTTLNFCDTSYILFPFLWGTFKRAIRPSLETEFSNTDRLKPFWKFSLVFFEYGYHFKGYGGVRHFVSIVWNMRGRYHRSSIETYVLNCAVSSTHDTFYGKSTYLIKWIYMKLFRCQRNNVVSLKLFGSHLIYLQSMNPSLQLDDRFSPTEPEMLIFRFCSSSVNGIMTKLSQKYCKEIFAMIKL